MTVLPQFPQFPPPPVFVVRLRPAAGSDGIRELRMALKVLARRFGLKCLGVTAEPVEASEARGVLRPLKVQ